MKPEMINNPNLLDDLGSYIRDNIEAITQDYQSSADLYKNSSPQDFWEYEDNYSTMMSIDDRIRDRIHTDEHNRQAELSIEDAEKRHYFEDKIRLVKKVAQAPEDLKDKDFYKRAIINDYIPDANTLAVLAKESGFIKEHEENDSLVFDLHIYRHTGELTGSASALLSLDKSKLSDENKEAFQKVEDNYIKEQLAVFNSKESEDKQKLCAFKEIANIVDADKLLPITQEILTASDLRNSIRCGIFKELNERRSSFDKTSKETLLNMQKQEMKTNLNILKNEKSSEAEKLSAFKIVAEIADANNLFQIGAPMVTDKTLSKDSQAWILDKIGSKRDLYNEQNKQTMDEINFELAIDTKVPAGNRFIALTHLANADIQTLITANEKIVKEPEANPHLVNRGMQHLINRLDNRLDPEHEFDNLSSREQKKVFDITLKATTKLSDYTEWRIKLFKFASEIIWRQPKENKEPFMQALYDLRTGGTRAENQEIRKFFEKNEHRFVNDYYKALSKKMYRPLSNPIKQQLFNKQKD